MESTSYLEQEQAEVARREAEQGSLRDFRYPHQRAEAFGKAAMLFEQAGLANQAKECSWDAQLWWTGTASLGTLRKGEQYFRPIDVLPASDDDQTAGGGSEPSRVLVAGSPHAISDEAKAYFDRQLNTPCPPLIQARYADFLFDQKYTAGMHRPIDYATLAVNAYIDAARSALPEADLTIDAAIFLLRAAFVAASVQQDTLIDAVRIAVVDGLGQLRDEGRFRFTIELTRALLTLGRKVPRQDLELAADILQKGARIEHEAGRYYAERPFLGALVDTRKALKDTVGAREAERMIAESYEADANARGVASHLAAAAHLEDAIEIYQRLRMPRKTDELLRRIREQYQAAENDFGQIEVRGAIPRAEVDRLYDVRLAPLSLDEALHALGAEPSLQPSYRLAEEKAQQAAQIAPLASMAARTIIRDDSPTRRVQDATERYRAIVQRQFLFIVNLTGIVIGILLERLEREKGLNAQSLGDYFERWPLMDPRHVPFLRRGFERYYADDYISASHILTPQVEGVLRSLLWQQGLVVTGLTRDAKGIDADTLSGLLRRQDVKDALGPGDDLWRYLDTVLSAQDGLNLRNDIAHGLVKQAQATKVACVLVIHLLLCLTRFQSVAWLGDDDVPPEGDPQ
jgi:Domain of unknown function (DUF4209)